MAQVATMARSTSSPVFEEPPKATVTYRIYLDPGQDGWLVVTSPDLKTIITQGKNEDEAIRNAYDLVHLLHEEEHSTKEFNLVIVDR